MDVALPPLSGWFVTCISKPRLEGPHSARHRDIPVPGIAAVAVCPSRQAKKCFTHLDCPQKLAALWHTLSQLCTAICILIRSFRGIKHNPACFGRLSQASFRKISEALGVLTEVGRVYFSLSIYSQEPASICPGGELGKDCDRGRCRGMTQKRWLIKNDLRALLQGSKVKSGSIVITTLLRQSGHVQCPRGTSKAYSQMALKHLPFAKDWQFYTSPKLLSNGVTEWFLFSKHPQWARNFPWVKPRSLSSLKTPSPSAARLGKCGKTNGKMFPLPWLRLLLLLNRS